MRRPCGKLYVREAPTRLDVQHLRIHGRAARAGPLSTHLRALARGELPVALDRVMPAILARAGLDDEAVVLVRRLRVRLEVGRLGADQLASGWASAIGAALVALLERGAPGDGAWTEDIAVFPDRISAEWHGLVAAVEGEAPWWWSSLTSSAPVPAYDIIEDWIEVDPGRAVVRIVSLAERLGAHVTVALPADGGLLARLADRRATVAAGLRGAVRPVGSRRDPLDEDVTSLAQPSAAGAMEHAAPPLRRAFQRTGAATDHPPLRALDADTDVSQRVEQTQIVRTRELAPGPRGHALRSALAVASPSTRRLLLVCAAWRERPALGVDEAEAVAAAWFEAASGEAHAGARSSRASASSRTTAFRSSQTQHEIARPPGGTPPPRPPSLMEHEIVQSINTSLGLPVPAGGLLFLIRWLASDALVLDAPLPQLAQALYSFGHAALALTLSTRSPGEARLLIEANEPVNRIFAGLDPQGPAVAVAEVTPAVSAALDRLIATLPEELDTAPDGPLASLILRPGHLRWSEARADLTLSMSLVDPAIRQGGWDIDPGYVPWLGRTIRFHYVEDRR